MIKLLDVTKKYPLKTALDNVSLELENNKIYCLLGRNGAGKTTLFKLIAGHIDATAGKVLVDGKEVNTIQMPASVNFIESRAVQFNVSVKELIRMAKSLQDDFDDDFAELMLKKFELNTRKKYYQLSFGMQTMLTTLISLSSNQKVIILDEPVLGFDAIMRSQFYELLSDSFESHPRIIIISTHLIDEIAKSTEELIIINDGRIMLQTSINEIDDKAYSVTGPSGEIEPLINGLNVIGKKTAGAFTTVSIFDKRVSFPGNSIVQPLGLQEFFVQMVGGNQHE